MKQREKSKAFSTGARRLFLASSILICHGCSRTEEPAGRHDPNVLEVGKIEDFEVPNLKICTNHVNFSNEAGNLKIPHQVVANQTESSKEIVSLRPPYVVLSDPRLPEQTRKALDLVSDVTNVLRWEEDRPIRIEETESEIIVVWPSRNEGARFRSDYEARAVIDKRTFTVVSRKRGS
jgi:hypothetical protein